VGPRAGMGIMAKRKKSLPCYWWELNLVIPYSFYIPVVLQAGTETLVHTG